MHVLVEGRINYSLTMRDLLKRIFQMQTPGSSFVRIVSADGSRNGRVFLLDSIFITGADLKESGETGYAALKSLLKIEEGSFALISMREGDPVETDLSMNIEIRKIVENLDDLPENPSVLFDQSALLDKVFNPAIEAAMASANANASSFAPPAAEPVPHSILGKVVVPEQASPPVDPATQPGDVIWSALPPSLASESDIPPVAHFGAQYTNVPRPDSPRTTNPRITAELRSLSSPIKVETQRGIRRAVLLAGALVVALAACYSVFWIVSTNTATIAPTAPQANLQAGDQANPLRFLKKK